MTRGAWAWLRGQWGRLVREGADPAHLAAAVFVGVVVGVTPFYGLQMLLVLLISSALRLNKVAALAAVQISVPPLYPFLVIASLETGNLLLRGTWLGVQREDLPTTTAAAWRMLGELSGVWLLGSLVVGVVLGGLAAALAYLLALRSPEEEAEEEHRVWKESQRLTAQRGPD